MTEKDQEIYHAWVDGSFLKEHSVWAFIIVNDKDEEIFRNGGILYGEINLMRQIGGELKAVIESIRWAKSQKTRIIIHHDLELSQSLVRDLFSNKLSWRAKNEWTKKYREFVTKNRVYIQEFMWIKGHLKENNWNNEVDEYLREVFKNSKEYGK